MARAAPALFAAALLSGCLGRGQDAGGEVRSMTLSYPHQVEAAFLFDGYQALAGEAAASYTRVVIIDPDTSAEDGRGPGGRAVVNAASGVIVHPAGYVVTAAHIALDRRFVAEVITFDGRAHAAEIVRVDRARELALLRMSPFPGMRPARLGDSDLVQEGELVLAIGAPGNRPGVVSPGSVVQTKRPTRLEYNGYGYDDAIKLHIDVEPGNSGGPVVNRAGEVIGMVASFVLGDTSQADYVSPRLAYAVPSNAIAAFLREAAGP